MTSRISAPTDRRPAAAAARRRRGGFTLVELLVVIGIMAVLMALLAPMIMQAWRSANRTRMASDLQAIATALEAYHQDHGAYPPVRLDTNIPGPPTAPPERPNPPTGAQILCWALIGPGPAFEPSAPANARLKQDGLDGPGFRTRRTAGPDGDLNTADDVFVGRPNPPYLAADRFKIGDPAGGGEILRYVILDHYEKPILYMPASPTKPNVRVAGNSYVARSETSRYDANDDFEAFREPGEPDGIVLNKIRWMLGDLNANGYIDGAEIPVEQPFLLWSAGPDDVYGPKAEDREDTGVLDVRDVEKCDDVTNFRP
jgi:prepilin-type N-terminal cleavage/methylation domain-containing protein